MQSAKKSDINRKRMEMALKQVGEILEESSKRSDKKPEELQKKYRALVRKFPLMLRKNGLGASFGYLYSKELNKEKKRTEHGFLMKHLIDWTLDNTMPWVEEIKGIEKVQTAQSKEAAQPKKADTWMLMMATQVGDPGTSLSNGKYRILQRELLAYTTWLKRIAEAKIKSS